MNDSEPEIRAECRLKLAKKAAKNSLKKALDSKSIYGLIGKYALIVLVLLKRCGDQP